MGMLILNIISLNLVIALTGEEYDRVMMSRKEIKLKLKAQMLKNLYDFKSQIRFFPTCTEVGNIYLLREEQMGEADDEWHGKIH